MQIFIIFDSNRIYGEEHVINITLAQQELSILKKIHEIRKKMFKKSSKNERESVKVNPFLSLMYYKLSFKSWRSNTFKNNIRRQNGQNLDLVPEMHNDSIAQESVYSEYTVKIEEMDNPSHSGNYLTINFSNYLYDFIHFVLMHI